MTEPLKRDNVIELLQRLGSDQDEAVLEAARQVHAQITAAGMTWEDLLVPDAATDMEDDAEYQESEDATPEPPADEEDDVEYQNTEDAPLEQPAETAKKIADTLELIDELLAKTGTSEDLREELENYKTAVEEGKFEESDRRYVRALHERLSKRR